MPLKVLLFTLSAALLPVSAHFSLRYPAVRGDNEDDLGKAPCGAFDTPSSSRTPVSTSSLAIDLEMGHDQSAIQVLLGLGNNPGNNFNITLLPTFRQEGLGQFCLPEIPIPAGLGIMDGMNATLQVVTNGDPNGGLYNCADVTFSTETVTPPSQCRNGTGVTANPFPPEAAARNANESTPEGESQSGSSGQSPSVTDSGAAETSQSTGDASAARLGLGLLGITLLGAVALL